MNEEHFKKITQSLMDFCRDRLGYDKDPDVRYLRDEENAKALLGTTANYNPSSRTVSVFISKRHPKDILRSLAHELVHHDQCCRGELDNSATPPGYAQKDPHMRNMEKEAYLKGNMMFRDWEDHAKQSGNLLTLRFIGENNMKDLKDYIEEEINKLLKEMENKKNVKERVTTTDDGLELATSQKRAPGDFGDRDTRQPKKDRSQMDDDEYCTDLYPDIGPKWHRCMRMRSGRMEEGSMKKTSRFKEGDKVRHDEHGTGRVVSRGGANKKNVGIRWDEGHNTKPQQVNDDNLNKVNESKVNELTQVKKDQDSIKSLNENRLMNLNKRLMEKLLK